MDERDKQQRERREREMDAIGARPRRQLEMFAAGKRSYCTTCHLEMRFEEACANPLCQYPIEISNGSLMRDLRRLVNIIRIDEAKRLLGYDDNTNANATTSTNNATASASESTTATTQH